MIAEPPSALALFFRRIMDARRERKRPRTSCGPVDGGRLVAEAERRLPPTPKQPPSESTALTPLPPPRDPPMDILSSPDRDHLRRVVPDEDYVDYDLERPARFTCHG